MIIKDDESIKHLTEQCTWRYMKYILAYIIMIYVNHTLLLMRHKHQTQQYDIIKICYYGVLMTVSKCHQYNQVNFTIAWSIKPKIEINISI